MNSIEVKERLEQQSAITYNAELALIKYTLDEMDAAEVMKDYERSLYLEAGSNPELTNDKKRTGWVAERMSTGMGAELRAAQKIVYQNKLQAQAMYNRERRYGQHLVAIVSLLRPA